jgi:hypothetical protein
VLFGSWFTKEGSFRRSKIDMKIALLDSFSVVSILCNGFFGRWFIGLILWWMQNYWIDGYSIQGRLEDWFLILGRVLEVFL